MRKTQAISEGYTYAFDQSGNVRKINDLSNDEIKEGTWIILDKQSFKFNLKETELRDLLLLFLDRQNTYYTTNENDDIYELIKNIDLTRTLSTLNTEFAKKSKHSWRNPTNHELESEINIDNE